jgi:hypothetical protein
MADVSARHLGIPALFILLAGNFILQQPAPARVPSPATTAPLARYTLAQQAEFPVGVVNGDNAPGLALCPDGTLYAGIRGSGLKAFDPAGKLLLTDTAIPLPRYPGCYACDAQRRLYTAEHKLSIFEPTADGKLKQVSSSSMHAVLQRLLIAPDGTIFGLNYEPKNRLSLVIISKEGKILRSFGDHEIVRSYGFADRSGILVWDATGKRIVYDAPGGLDLRFFDVNGKELNFKPANKADKTPGAIPRLEASPALHNLVSLANGQFVAEEITNSDKFDKFYDNLRIYDASLNAASELISITKVGSLIGATQDGSVYFLRTQAGGKLSVVRASLQPVAKK